MFNDEDFGLLTGGLGDLNGDGKVDFTEYMMEEDFERMMSDTDKGDSFLNDDFDSDDDFDGDGDFDSDGDDFFGDGGEDDF